MAIPLAAAAAGVATGFGIDSHNQRSKVRNRDREISNLKTENQALRDQLEQAQNQQGGATPWSNLLQFSQINSSYQQQQQPTNQLLNLASQLMQLMSQGMGSSPTYSGMFGPQSGGLGNATGTAQSLFGQLQNLMQLSGGLYNAMQAYEGLQQRQSPVVPFNVFNQNGLPLQDCAENPLQGYAQNPLQGYSQNPLQGYTQNPPPVYAQSFRPTYDQPLAPTYGQPNSDRAIITTLGKNASKLFPSGGNISMSDIQQIAQGGRCPDGTEAPADLKMACQALSSNPALFNKLQSAFQASKGRGDTDGLASVSDVQTLMSELKEATPNSSAAFNPNTPVRPYSPNSAYGSSFVNALMGHLQSTGVNPYLLNLLQQPGMQQAGTRQPQLAF
ncbi:hypothetical protein ACFX58_14505 [Sphingomonas sp. NCPPB 2930]